MKTVRSFLIMPGNNPGMLLNAGIFGADIVVFDLEDSVSIREKDAARALVAGALKSLDYGRTRIIVRINSMDTFGEDDIKTIVPCKPFGLLVPKVNIAQEIQEAAALIGKYEREGQEKIKLLPIIETARGVIEAFNIASANERIVTLSFGAEDYTADIGAKRSKSGEEILQARTAVVNAAAAAGIYAEDTVFTDVNDEEGLIKDTKIARQLGFRSKCAIHPRQIKVINDIFSPGREDILWAKRVITAIHKAEEEGAGVIAVDGKMIDAPVKARAEQIMQTAELLGLNKEADL